MKRYIGNKANIIFEIEKFIDSNKINASTFIDLYSGTGSVANYFRSKYKIIANDIMYYSYVVLKAKLSFKSSPEFKTFIKKYGNDPINEMNSLKIVKNSTMII